jgi:hypothetical protein
MANFGFGMVDFFRSVRQHADKGPPPATDESPLLNPEGAGHSGMAISGEFCNRCCYPFPMLENRNRVNHTHMPATMGMEDAIEIEFPGYCRAGTTGWLRVIL